MVYGIVAGKKVIVNPPTPVSTPPTPVPPQSPPQETTQNQGFHPTHPIFLTQSEKNELKEEYLYIKETNNTAINDSFTYQYNDKINNIEDCYPKLGWVGCESLPARIVGVETGVEIGVEEVQTGVESSICYSDLDEPLTLELFFCTEKDGPIKSRLISILKNNEDDYALSGFSLDEFEYYVGNLCSWEDIEDQVRPYLKSYLVCLDETDGLKFFIVKDSTHSVFAECISVDTGEIVRFKYEDLLVNSLAYRANN